VETFLLVLAAAGGGVMCATAFGSELTLAMKALAPGIMVLAPGQRPRHRLGCAQRRCQWCLTHWWIYLVGPAIGALLAVSFEWILRGKATTAGGAAAQGILNADDPNAL
jgi:hypothetical protein